MGPRTLSDLVAAAREGDAAAFGRIVEAFQRMAHGYAYALLGDFALAEDAAQEAFLQAFRSLGRLRDARAFPGWLKQIVRHCSSRLRRSLPPPAVSLDDTTAGLEPAAAPGSFLREYEARNQVQAALRSLPCAQREVTTLFYIDGYSQGEIAAFLDVPVNTVKSRLRVARERLKEATLDMVRDTLKKHTVSDAFMQRIQQKLGRQLTEHEHERWHREHPGGRMTAEQHRDFMKKMGVSEEQDRKWHERHGVPQPKQPRKRTSDSLSPARGRGSG
jgi:RNA polymerase sigma factor (sigma-70 family)